VVIVDDGSRDQTLAAIAPGWRGPGRVPAAVPQLRQGGGAGRRLDHARGDVVFTLDADLQHPVEFLPQMLQSGAKAPTCVRGAA